MPFGQAVERLTWTGRLCQISKCCPLGSKDSQTTRTSTCWTPWKDWSCLLHTSGSMTRPQVRTLKKKKLCQFLWFQCSTATCTGVQKKEPEVQLYSQRRQTGRNGRAVGMTQDPSGANPFSGGQSKQQFDKAIVFQRSCYERLHPC